MSQPVSLLDNFPAEEFLHRRTELRRQIPDGIILLRGATEEEVVTGQRYRQNSAFAYYTGVETPGAFLAILPADLPASAGNRSIPEGVREVLFLPDRNPVVETWTGPKLGPGAETEALTGFPKVVSSSSFFTVLTGWLRRNSLIRTIAPFGEGATLTREYAFIRRIFDLAPIARFEDCARAMMRQRISKSPLELEQMRKAIAISEAGQLAAKQAIESGECQYEYQVEAKIIEAFRSRGAAHAFQPIVGSGFRATVLHYEDNHGEMTKGELVVVDIGARVGSYCGDLTRAYAVGGKMNERQAEIYDLVRRMHRFVLDTFQRGEDSLKSLDDRAKDYLDNDPFKAKTDSGEEKGGRDWMPHGLSHHLGMDVHDVNLQADREEPLPAGSVITIEPGVYIPSEGIGVRLENDYLITEDGIELLGSLPIR